MTTGPSFAEEIVVALDPGREKCGLAVVKSDNSVVRRMIVPRREAVARALELIDIHEARVLALGHSTESGAVQQELFTVRPGLAIEIINEHGSTFEARSYYWAANPPTGWRRLLPLSMQLPPVPLDDWAAVVLAERYFRKQAAARQGLVVP